MKIQLEQLDLLEPWPQFALREGFRAIRVLVRIGQTPIGQVSLHPARKRLVAHNRLRCQIAKHHAQTLLKHLSQAVLAAGPEAIGWLLPHAWPEVDLARADRDTLRRFVERNVLLTTGLPSPLRDWVLRSLAATHAMLPVTVALCTRDRAATLESTIRRLQALDYPDFDILVVDNSADSVPTRHAVEHCADSPIKLHYARCKSPGASHARNAALTHAKQNWIAFIDDDAIPEKGWLKAMVRPTHDANCRAVVGLVLPAHLSNAAEIVADARDTQGTSHDAGFTPHLLSRDPNTWPANAGTSLLVQRAFAQSAGGFDIHLGPGKRSVAARDDVDFLDRLLREGGNVHFAPAAVVHHDREMTAKALRQHVQRQAAGRAAILANRAFAHRDLSALRELLTLPRTLLRQVATSLRPGSSYPFTLALAELRTTLAAPLRYGLAKLKQTVRPPRTSPTWAGPVSAESQTPRHPIKPKMAA